MGYFTSPLICVDEWKFDTKSDKDEALKGLRERNYSGRIISYTVDEPTGESYRQRKYEWLHARRNIVSIRV